VLSVVAQQVLTIIRAKAAKVQTFLFEGEGDTDVIGYSVCGLLD
jgi:hypothetical protein